MRHKIKKKKLNRTSTHRKSMLANIAVSLVMNEQIQTTTAKAKTLRPYIEKLITKARAGNLSARRNIISVIQDKTATDKLMSVLSTRYKSRPGGYTRIIKSGFRYGDRAPVSYIEFVDRDVSAKGSAALKNKNLTEKDSIKK